MRKRHIYSGMVFWKASKILLLVFVLIVTGIWSAKAQINSRKFADARILSLGLQPSVSELNAKKVTLKYDKVSIERLLRYLEQKEDIRFSYSKGLFANNPKITLRLENTSLDNALKEIFKNTEIDFYPLKGGYIVLRKRNHKIVQEIVQGTVIDAGSRESLPGVNILLKGTSTGTSSDTDGHYELSVPSLQDTLIFSFVGYKKQLIPIRGRTTINVEMASQTYSGGEMVVVAYGTQQKSQLTGAISSINSEDAVEGQAVTNVEQALQGKVPGVQIHYASGEPGAPMQIQVRGVGTFGNSDPLYVVDGVPIKAEDMTTINPSDIESMEVLKDASAAAIYGARAANGVVLITTKKGKEGQVRFNYNGYYGWQSFTDFIPMVNSQQYADIVNESSIASGYPLEPAYNNPDNLSQTTNWQDAAFRTAPMTNHSLTISGGTEDATYSISGNYLDQDGIMVFNWIERYNARINTKFNLNDKFTIGESISIGRTKGLNRHRGNNLDFSYLLGASPTMRIYNPDNEGGYAGPNPEETGINNRDNVIERRDMRRTYDTSDLVIGNFFAQYDILPQLTYKLNFGLHDRLNRYHAFTPTFEAGNRTNRTASLSENNQTHNHYLLENLLTYKTQISKNYDVTLLAGYTQEYASLTGLSGSIREFPSNDLRVIDAGTGSYNIGGNESKWSLRSYLARANVTLFDKYLFTGTFRRDGSSRFGKENRYGNFPSLALGWIISRENFMKKIPYISELKIRASWGKLGNQEIGNYVNQTTVSTAPRYILGDAIAPAAAVVSLGNPSLKWETTVQTDLGFDLEMFNNEVALTADYYVKDTKDVLLRVPISSATGVERNNGPYQNAAGIKNSGFEFQATYRKALGDLSYSISGNISTVKNEVTSLGGESSIINYVANAYHYGTFTYTTIGKPMSSYYGYIFDGIFQNQAEIDGHATQPGAHPGDAIFRDINNDGIVDANDRTIIGNPFPDFAYGFNASANYDGFDLSLSIQGVRGRDLYNSQRAFLESLNGEHGQMATTVNRWTGSGTSNTMPRAVRDDPNDNARPSTRFVEDASYLRVQNLQLGYTLPGDLIARAGLTKLRIYFNGQNLLTLTGYTNYSPDVRGGAGWAETSGDPLAIGVDTGSYPIPRVYQLGIQMSF